MVDREPTSFELFHSYMRGWRAGAGRKPKDSRYKGHPTLQDIYEKGFIAGINSAVQEEQAAAKRLNYSPSILRIEGTDAADRVQTRLPNFLSEDGEHRTPGGSGRRGGRGRE